MQEQSTTLRQLECNDNKYFMYKAIVWAIEHMTYKYMAAIYDIVVQAMPMNDQIFSNSLSMEPPPNLELFHIQQSC